MRIKARVFQNTLKLSDHALAQNMFDFFCIVMNVVGCVTSLIGEIQLPEPVVADNLAGPLPTFRSEGKTIVLRKAGAVPGRDKRGIMSGN